VVATQLADNLIGLSPKVAKCRDYWLETREGQSASVVTKLCSEGRARTALSIADRVNACDSVLEKVRGALWRRANRPSSNRHLKNITVIGDPEKVDQPVMGASKFDDAISRVEEEGLRETDAA